MSLACFKEAIDKNFDEVVKDLHYLRHYGGLPQNSATKKIMEDHHFDLPMVQDCVFSRLLEEKVSELNDKEPKSCIGDRSSL